MVPIFFPLIAIGFLVSGLDLVNIGLACLFLLMTADGM
jgi:hypothetical protein